MNTDLTKDEIWELQQEVCRRLGLDPADVGEVRIAALEVSAAVRTPDGRWSTTRVCTPLAGETCA